MKIRWLESGKYEAVTGFDGSTGEPIINVISAIAGDEIEVMVVQNNEAFRTSTIAYQNGMVLHGVPNYTFLVI
jgi:hypothetical protein